ncbi:MAG: peptidoglycan editing factor PgeF [Syntrophales bacterium LBB04]|nr:peptidoglycan editing factor PgeF [Syntrophales bacterium LBB04]
MSRGENMLAFKHCKKGTVEYFESPLLAGRDFLLHAFSTRRGGVSRDGFASLNFSKREGDGAENVRRNWEILADAFQLSPEQFLLMDQIHGDGILAINEGMEIPPEGHRQFDALVTDRPGIALVIKTADCVPLLMMDPVRRVIGVGHAGWRGTALNIAGKVVDTFVKSFSSRTEDILVAIGPAIGACCYQVDAPVYEALASHPGAVSFLHPQKEQGRWILYLAGVNRLQMEERGVPPENISSADHCTSCRGDVFYSHRRDGIKTGRHVNFIMLK